MTNKNKLKQARKKLSDTDIEIKILQHGFNFNVGNQNLLEIFGFNGVPDDIGEIFLSLKIEEQEAQLKYGNIKMVSITSESLIVDADIVDLKIKD